MAEEKNLEVEKLSEEMMQESEETEVQDASGQADGDEQTKDEKVEKKGETPVERLYDRIPLTYEQVDIITKFSIVLLIIILAIAILDAKFR